MTLSHRRNVQCTGIMILESPTADKPRIESMRLRRLVKCRYLTGRRSGETSGQERLLKKDNSSKSLGVSIFSAYRDA